MNGRICLLFLCLGILGGDGWGKDGASDSIWIREVRLPSLPAEGMRREWCLKPQQAYTLEAFQECCRQDSLALLRWVQGQGYWFARVRLYWDSGQGRMEYVVEPGDPVRIGELTVTCLPDSPASLGAMLQAMGTAKVGAVASQGLLEALLDSLVLALSRVGYPDARADLSDVRLVGQSAKVSVHVWRGDAARADTILFPGAEQTRWSFLQRWAGISKRDILADSVLYAIQRRLGYLPWLEVVEIPRRQRLSDGRWAAVVPLRERSATSLEGLVGYTPPAQGRGGWSGMIETQLRNLFGTGRLFLLRWYRAASAIQEIGIQYEEPLPPMLLVRGRYEMRQRDTVATETLWEAGLRWIGALSSLWQAELFGGWYRFQPSGVAPSLPSSTALSIGGYGSFGMLRPRLNPVEGIVGEVRLTYQWRRFALPLGGQQGRIGVEGDGEAVYQLFRPCVVRLHIHTRLLWGRGLRWEEFFRLGGMQGLRGYREVAFWTPRAFWGGIEGRWLLGAQEYIALFLDNGWLRGWGWKASMGFQWQAQTAVGMLQLFLAWGSGNPLRQAVLGVRLMHSGR